MSDKEDGIKFDICSDSYLIKQGKKLSYSEVFEVLAKTSEVNLIEVPTS